MSAGLVLSIFPGLDVLGMGFEAEGFAVVAGPDVCWGRDVRTFHPPAERFDGVIGGDPCQAHSRLSNLVRAKGLEPRHGDLSGEFARVVEEAWPAWFLRENVPAAPDAMPEGYSVRSFELDNAWIDSGNGIGHEQIRKRRLWFGWRAAFGLAPDLRAHIPVACFVLPKADTVMGDDRRTPVALGGTGKLKPRRRSSVTGAHRCAERPKQGHGERYTLAEMLRLQGLGPEVLEHAPFTVEGARRLVGNAVPLPMARALARAVLEATAPLRPERRPFPPNEIGPP